MDVVKHGQKGWRFSIWEDASKLLRESPCSCLRVSFVFSPRFLILAVSLFAFSFSQNSSNTIMMLWRGARDYVGTNLIEFNRNDDGLPNFQTPTWIQLPI